SLAVVPVVLAAVEAMDRRWLRAALLLLLAAMLHPQMAFFGALFLVFLAWRAPLGNVPAIAAVALPLEFLLRPAPPRWQEAVGTRLNQFLVVRWHWYELLGFFGPLALLWLFAAIGKRRGWRDLPHLCQRLIAFGLFGFAVALAVCLPQLLRLAPFQPMR